MRDRTTKPDLSPASMAHIESKILAEEKFRLWQRNVVDKFKPLSEEDIKNKLQETAFPAAVLMSQIEGDFNIGCVIRAANNFNLSKVFYYGRKHYDKRSACGTYKYTDVVFLTSLEEVEQLKWQYTFVGLDNNIKKKICPIKDYVWSPNSLVVLGEENSGIPEEVLDLCDDFVEIPTRGSVRSLNVASAASIAFYDYCCKFS
jgi:tRNA G18 (ribose-2'-O)-methylase SpoU